MAEGPPRRFRDTWLRCPVCGNEREFQVMTSGYKTIIQFSDDKTREETGFYPMGDAGDTIVCVACDHFGEYHYFVAD